MTHYFCVHISTFNAVKAQTTSSSLATQTGWHMAPRRSAPANDKLKWKEKKRHGGNVIGKAALGQYHQEPNSGKQYQCSPSL